jgi:hypothetical protein
MQVYADLFAIVTLFLGGGLAAYGLLLYNKMCRVKTSQASADIHKVAGLAVASVVCFSLRAFIVLVFDNPVSFCFCFCFLPSMLAKSMQCLWS